MARESQLVHELCQRFLLPRAIVETNGYDSIKDTMLNVLRQMFSKHPEYTYVPDPQRGFDYPDLEKTKISIWQEYPYDTLFLPCLLINIGSVRSHPISFNQNMGTIDYLHDEQGNIVYNTFGQPIPNYYEYAGAWDSSFTVTINAQSPWDRDLLADFITINLTHVYRDFLYTRGVFINNVSTSGESVSDWRNQQIHKISVTADIYSEWTNRIPVPTDVWESIMQTIYAPISTQAIVPPEGIINGEKMEEVATIVSLGDEIQTVDIYNDKKPVSAMDTIAYNSTTNQWEITEAWWTKIAYYLSGTSTLQMLQAKYGISSLTSITTEQWFDILASISSAVHLGYLKTIQDVQVGIEAAAALLSIDPEIPLADGYQSTEYNRLLQLQQIKEALGIAYRELVTRSP